MQAVSAPKHVHDKPSPDIVSDAIVEGLAQTSLQYRDLGSSCYFPVYCTIASYNSNQSALRIFKCGDVDQNIVPLILEETCERALILYLCRSLTRFGPVD